MADRRFKIGDVVRLKSGGPQMTVTSLPNPYPAGAPFMANTTWFAGTKAESGTFPEAALDLDDDISDAGSLTFE